MAPPPEKRCLYDVLGLPRDCSPEEIRSAYKKLALQRHPDKLIQTGVSPDDATAQFQELLHAYETLSDPKERSWYDSHRSQILFSDPNAASADSLIPDLFAFFSTSVFSGYSDSGKGFYKVYSDVFDRIYANEVNYMKKMGLGVEAVKEVPLMGNLDSPYEQVNAFYGYWLGFCTAMDFMWADVYDAERGENRKSRRVMEEENKKVRKKAKREYNETVRGLAEFVKKRDKRVILRKKEEEERRKKKEEERERERKEKRERERAERARKYEEAEWTRVEDDDAEEWEDEQDGEENEEEEAELYCAVCGKKFRSKKQWENHEKSKKHKEKVAALRRSFVDDDDFHEDEEQMNREEDDELEEMTRKVREAFEIMEDEEEERNIKTKEINEEEEGIEGENGMSEEQERLTDANDVDQTGEAEEIIKSSGDDGRIDEGNLLAAMLGGRKNRRKMAAMEKASISKVVSQNGEEEVEFMEYANRKTSRRNRGVKKDKARKNNALSSTTGEIASNNLDETVNEREHKVTDGSSDRSRSRGGQSNGVENVDKPANPKVRDKSLDKKREANVDDSASTKPRNATKGRKAKATSKYLDNTCEGCGQEFDSRNKLHKHLGETGHASIKFRR